jgi:hypothetical protein
MGIIGILMRGKITEYMRFYSYVEGELNYDGLPRDEEFTATPEEMGFLRRYQVARARSKVLWGKPGKKYEEATIEDLLLLGRRGIGYPSERYARAKRKAW